MADFTFDQIESTSILCPSYDALAAGALTIGGTTATSVVLGQGGVNTNVQGELIVAGSGAKGDLLAGNGTSIGPVSLTFPADEGKILVARAAQARGIAWETSAVTAITWATVDFDTVVAVSPVASIASGTERSEYAVNDSVCYLNVDLEVLTDGTGPSVSLQFDIPGGKSIPAAGASGTRYSGHCFITSIGGLQMGYMYLDAGVGSGNRVTVVSTGVFANATTFRIHGSITYRLS